jgi:apolipoprotein N-acyltransferase
VSSPRARWILTAVSGVFFVLTFPRSAALESTPFLAIFLLVPWLWALSTLQGSLWRAVGYGSLLSVFATWGSFFWIQQTLEHFGGLHWSIAGFLTFVFSLFHQTQFLIFAPILVWALRREPELQVPTAWQLSLRLALTYTAIDLTIPKLFTDTLGHVFFASPWMRQSADFWGVGGLTFLLIWTQLILLLGIRSFRTRGEQSWWPVWNLHRQEILTISALWLGCFVYGKYRLEAVENWTNSASKRVPMAIIQANIGDFDKIAAEKGVRGAASTVLNQYFKLSEQALQAQPRPQVILWPETAYPSTFRTPISPDEFARDEAMEKFVKTQKVHLWFGGYDHGNGRDYNALFLLSPQINPKAPPPQDQQTYRKNVLLMFGEYIPGSDYFPWIGRQFPQVGNFGRGEGPQALPVRVDPQTDFRVSPLICYEALFADYSIESARLGGQLLLNVTNDSWFGDTGEPGQHLALVTFRSVETRLPQIRATNTGISTLILPTGEMPQRTETFKPEILQVEVPFPEKPLWTLVNTLGNWFPRFSLAMALVLWALTFRRSRAKTTS